jgi:hypothetical protein
VVEPDLNHEGIDDFKFVAASNAYARSRTFGAWGVSNPELGCKILHIDVP